MTHRKVRTGHLFPALYATIASVLAFAPSRASASEEVLGAEAAAMGGASAAAVGDNSAITGNPAAIGLAERYDASGFFRYGPSAGLRWGATVVDARTLPQLSLGFSYSGDRYEGELFPGDGPGWTVPGEPVENAMRSDDLALALAVPFLDRRLSVGVNAALQFYDHDRLGTGRQFQMDAGLGFRPVDALALGVAVRNFLPLEGLGDRPLGVVGGAKLFEASIGAVVVDVGWTDVGNKGDPWTVAAGAEKTLGEYVMARGGFRADGPTDRRDVTVGFGLGAQGATLDLGLAVPLSAGKDTLDLTQFLISLKFGIPDPHDMDW